MNLEAYPPSVRIAVEHLGIFEEFKQANRAALANQNNPEIESTWDRTYDSYKQSIARIDAFVEETHSTEIVEPEKIDAEGRYVAEQIRRIREGECIPDAHLVDYLAEKALHYLQYVPRPGIH
jgi:hypothetical protein